MSDRNRIEDEVRKTMESLDGVNRVSPKLFLFTRVMGRIQRADGDPVSSGMPYPRLVLSLLVFLLVVNVVIISMSLSGGSPAVDANGSETAYFEQYYPTLITLDDLPEE